jgi:hypothetical protein
MTWTAPAVQRPEPPIVAGERAALESWLDYQRATLLIKCAGLTGEQLATASVEPSDLTLLGLVRHMTEVERSWFRIRFLGESLKYQYSTDENPDGDFGDFDPARAEQDYEAFVAEIAQARAAVATRGLDETYHNSYYDAPMDLRWIFIHMIEEYARHNGHADLLRERIDGATGD